MMKPIVDYATLPHASHSSVKVSGMKVRHWKMCAEMHCNCVIEHVGLDVDVVMSDDERRCQ